MFSKKGSFATIVLFFATMVGCSTPDFSSSTKGNLGKLSFQVKYGGSLFGSPLRMFAEGEKAKVTFEMDGVNDNLLITSSDANTFTVSKLSWSYRCDAKVPQDKVEKGKFPLSITGTEGAFYRGTVDTKNKEHLVFCDGDVRSAYTVDVLALEQGNISFEVRNQERQLIDALSLTVGQKAQLVVGDKVVSSDKNTKLTLKVGEDKEVYLVVPSENGTGFSKIDSACSLSAVKAQTVVFYWKGLLGPLESQKISLGAGFLYPNKKVRVDDSKSSHGKTELLLSCPTFTQELTLRVQP